MIHDPSARPSRRSVATNTSPDTATTRGRRLRSRLRRNRSLSVATDKTATARWHQHRAPLTDTGAFAGSPPGHRFRSRSSSQTTAGKSDRQPRSTRQAVHHCLAGQCIDRVLSHGPLRLVGKRQDRYVTAGRLTKRRETWTKQTWWKLSPGRRGDPAS